MVPIWGVAVRLAYV